MSFITGFSYRHIWSQSSIVYIHQDSDLSHCDTHHLLYTDHTGCYSHCRSNVEHTLQEIIHKIKLALRNSWNIFIAWYVFFLVLVIIISDRKRSLNMEDKDKMTMLDKFTMLILGKETRRFFLARFAKFIANKTNIICLQYSMCTIPSRASNWCDFVIISYF